MPKLIGWNVRFSYSPPNVPGDEGYTGSTPFKGSGRNWKYASRSWIVGESILQLGMR
jgi:hypothetical protein